MSKKKGKFCGVYGKASSKFKAGQGTDPEVISPKAGWSQAEVDSLTEAAAKTSGRVGSGTGAKEKVKG
jgi:hypothetical protein